MRYLKLCFFFLVMFLFSFTLPFAGSAHASMTIPQQVLTLPISKSPDGVDCTVNRTITCSVSKSTEGAAVLADQQGQATYIDQNVVAITTTVQGQTLESIYTNLDSLNPALAITVSNGDQLGTIAAGSKLYVTFMVNGIVTNPNAGWWDAGSPRYYGEYVGGFWDNSTQKGGVNTDLGEFCHQKNALYTHAAWGTDSWKPWHCMYADNTQGEELDLNAARIWASQLLGYCNLLHLDRDGVSPFRIRLYNDNLVA